jgi:hypothetical protein
MPVQVLKPSFLEGIYSFNNLRGLELATEIWVFKKSVLRNTDVQF